ncbi:TPA: relaxase/mobilization nuclease domain-containing protein [Enterococcus faecalis]|uniref:relaxase/mobilization nuclease domain-containing protein n=3 Tax=Enterococcus faecalis TaxID=1351 RepID=UPI0003301613|nr:relaxase/mobilization nuclease domain-containing protein [Enterococcus faecalis]MDU7687978.1 relaxase/mobilization nuclease domain-containing protein [Bacillota bacterium]EGO7772998.1 relaxase/mobilization nuclease domain-containing protein [Enterococcus faecalis]EGO8075827.1 relaxase/mobilization nuclease domain-containing protein [Enterococcus faecalis]EHB5039345.1 relaxase/mobilization nuclease domain-containing protein [Enterococcus faecalis]EHB5039867.1 relaxase/mobilization nuclease d
MVYTKHFVIHTMKHLSQAKDYVEQATKTQLSKNEATDSHLDNLFPYVFNDDKTMSKQLVSGHGITILEDAANEFLLTKEKFARRKGTHIVFNPVTEKLEFDKKSIERGNGRGKAVLAHHLIQSFSPEDDLTPEQVHEIGRKTILEFTGGQHEFIVATHVDKAHIHNHIIVNSTNLTTGKALNWKIIKQQNGKNKDKTKELFEKVSDKISSEYGAKIIEKSPKNSHKKYTLWETESLYKKKIKSRLDFLLDHSSSIDDFLEKAEALNVSVDFSKKWTTYRLLDEPQIKNTRSRSLLKSDPTKYNYEKIIERLKENKNVLTLEEVVARYEEKSEQTKNEFDYQLTIDEWQISHKTTRGYYVNVDFGFGERGKVFIGAYKVDPLENGQYNIYVKRKDFFYLMNEKNADRNRYMTGETLIKQLRLYNGQTPLKKEPVMRTIDELVNAINFLAANEIEDTRQLKLLEEKLESAFLEAEKTLETLDEKVLKLHQLSNLLLENELQGDPELIQKKLKTLLPDATLAEFSYEDVQGEIEAIKTSQSILENKLERTRNEINQLREIQAVQKKEPEKQTDIKPKL